jgi:hypothetical protein
MKYDAGALSKNRNKSPIFRFLSNKPPRHICWPDKWRNELGILIATPDVSWHWLENSFNMSARRLWRVWQATKHLHHLAKENIYSVTREDAEVYMAHRPKNGLTPFWVDPFIIEDLKMGKGWRATAKAWGVSQEHIAHIMKGRSFNVFHSSEINGRRQNLDGRV